MSEESIKTLLSELIKINCKLDKLDLCLKGDAVTKGLMTRVALLESSIKDKNVIGLALFSAFLGAFFASVGMILVKLIFKF